jgi:predicted sugar kinase
VNPNREKISSLSAILLAVLVQAGGHVLDGGMKRKFLSLNYLAESPVGEK